MLELQGILSPSQRELGMSLEENDHCVSLLIKGKKLTEWNATAVTFAAIQVEAHDQECWIKSGIERVSVRRLT